MSSLLPIEQKKDIRKEYHVRVAVVGFVLLALTLAIAIVLLVPSYILAAQNNTIAEKELEQIREDITAGGEADPAEIIATANERIELLSENDDYPLLAYETIRKILEQRGDAIILEKLFYTANTEGAKIAINGVADSRTSLLAFSDRLEAVEIFTEVDFPISDFVKEQDIAFSMSVVAESANEEE